ncbi:MAG: hypothetical protein D6798_14750 [Deltaproteobacteria bacterium]|nr:MAG: hypothetical protein D6798_14750 [Deltaproteobacteria bacterium]
MFVDDLESMAIHPVVQNGEVVVSEGRLVDPVEGGFHDLPEALGHFRLPPLTVEDLRIPARPGRRIRVIRVQERSLLTDEEWIEPRVLGELAVADPDRDIAPY